MGILGGWLGLGQDDEEEDPVQKALRTMRQTAQSATDAAGAAASAVGSGISSAAEGVGRFGQSLVAPPSADDQSAVLFPQVGQGLYDAAEAAPERIRQSAGDLGTTLQTEGVVNPLTRAIANPIREATGRAPLSAAEQADREYPSARAFDEAVMETARSLPASLSAVGEGVRSGDLGQAGLGALGVAADLDPTMLASRQLNRMLPTVETPIGELGAGDIVGGLALGKTAVEAARGIPGVAKAGAGAVGRALEALGGAPGRAAGAEGDLVELGGGFVPSSRVRGEAYEPGARGAEARAYAERAGAADASEATVKKWSDLADADVANPEELAQKVAAWEHGPTTEEARAMLGAERPEYLDGVANFLVSQRKKLLDGQMTARDVAKAYGMTAMSMQAQAQKFDGLQAKLKNGFTMQDGSIVAPRAGLEDLDAMVNPHNGEPLGPIFGEHDPRRGVRMIRPESLGSAWFWSPDGQRALNEMTAGRFDPEAWQGLAQTRKAVGSDIVTNNGLLRPLTAEEQAAGTANMTTLPQWTREMNEGIAGLRAEGRDAEIGDWLTTHARKLNGIGEAKTAFIKQLLGMGDALTIDAREINYWMGGRGLRRKGNPSAGEKLAAAVSSWWTDPRVSGATRTAIERKVNDLVTQNPELLRGIDPADAGEIIHHWIWDKSAGSTTTHAAEQATQQLAAGLNPRLSPGLAAAASNAAQGALVGEAGGALEEQRRGEPLSPQERLAYGLGGAGLGLVAGSRAARDVAGRAANVAASTEASRIAAAREGRALAIRAPEAAAGGLVPRVADEDALARLSPVGRAAHDAYTALTPARAAATTDTAVTWAAGAVGREAARLKTDVPDAAGLMQDVHDAVVRNLDSSKVVMTHLQPAALRAYLRGEGLTTKAEAAGGLPQINEITRGQVNVGNKRAGSAYTLEQGADFAQRESEQMRMVSGGSRFPDPETGAVDTEAPRMMYAYVTDGQPLGGPNQPPLSVVWRDPTPRVTAPSHPFMLGSGVQVIHKGMAQGFKDTAASETAVRGSRMAPAIMQNGSLVEAAPGVGGEPMRFGWEQGGVEIGNGRRIADTDYLVGPEGESAIRASGLLLSMPKEVQRAVAEGRMTDPEQIAAVLQRGGAPQWKGGWAATMNRSRSESLIIDPSIENIEAIYITGGPEALQQKIPATGTRASQNLTVGDIAEQMRADVREKTGRDIPIIHNDTSGKTATAMADARVVSGPPTRLAPGRADIVNQYTRATNPKTGEPYTDIGGGFVPRVPRENPDQIADLARRAASATPPPGQRGAAAATVRHVAQEISAQAKAGVPRDVPTGPMPPPAPDPGWYDWSQTVRYGLGLFGQLSTALVQTAGGAAEAVLAAPTEVVRQTIRGTPEALLPIASRALGSLPGSVGAFAKTMAGKVGPELLHGSDYRPPLSQRLWARDEPGKTMPELGRPSKAGLAWAIETPGRFATQAPDAAAYHVYYETGLAQAASDTARAEGLRGGDLMARMRELTEAPTPEMEQQAMGYAKDATFKGDLGLVADTLGKVVRGPDGAPEAWKAVGSALMPVYGTIAKIHERALNYVPGVGMLPLNKLGLAAKGRPVDEKVAQQVVGLAASGAMLAYAANGGVRGPGPSDPNTAQAMRDQGYTPNSTNIAGYWVPNSYLGTAGVLLNEVGAYHDALLYDKQPESADDVTRISRRLDRVIRNSGRAFADYPTVQALTTLQGFFTNPTDALARFAGSYASQYAPGPVRTIATWTDPMTRTTDRGKDVSPVQAFLDTFRQRSGVWRSSLPAAQDILGRDAPNLRTGAASVLPRVGSDRPDPIISAFVDHDVTLGDPPKQLSVTGLSSSYEPPSLTPAEQRRWNTLRGQRVQEQLGPVLESDWWAQASPELRARYLTKIKGDAGDYAHAWLRQEIGPDEVRRRIEDATARKKAAS